MAKAKKVKIPTDVREVIQLLEAVNPEWSIHPTQLIEPTKDLVTQFYQFFLDKIHEYMSKLMNNQPLHHCQSENPQNFDPEVMLFTRISPIFTRLHIQITLYDIYQPTKKRTILLFKVALHYLHFLQAQLPEVMEKVQSVHQQVNLKEFLEKDREECLQQLGDLAVDQAKKLEILKHAQIKLDTIAKNHQKMLKQKELQDDKLEKNQMALKKDKEYCALLDYELQKEKEEEQELMEKMVTDSEFQHLQSCLDRQRNELEQLESNIACIDKGMDDEVDAYKRLDDCYLILRNIHFESGNINHLDTNRNKLRAIVKKLKKLEKEVDRMKVEKIQMKNDEVDLKRKFELKRNELANFKCTLEDEEIIQNNKLQQMVKNAGKFLGKLKSDINDLEEEKTKIFQRKELIKLKIVDEYSKILNVHCKIFN